MIITTRPPLRTKTGCLNCKQRRKKCDETPPICGGCRSTERDCRWPSPADLLDRRFASHYRSRHWEKPKNLKAARAKTPRSKPQSESLVDENCHNICQTARLRASSPDDQSLHLFTESKVFHGAITQHIELVISRHFVDKYYTLLLLPSCHSCFYNGWLTEIQELMVSHQSLYYSVLACAASHIYLSDESCKMQDLALTYYSKALRELSTFLSTISELESNNGLLISVMLLYLHGLTGWGTDTDISRHVNAATRILTIRLCNRPKGTYGLFDDLALESVLYQTFLVTLGLWSEYDDSNHEFDMAFWDEAEKRLDRPSRILKSPILGVPVALFRLLLSLRQRFRTRISAEQTAVKQIQREVAKWEMVFLSDTADTKEPQEAFYQDTSSLYTIVASFLLQQVLQYEANADSLCLPASNCWQIRKGVEIIKRYENADEWSRCYIGNWPIYTLGFFATSSRDRQVIRTELQRRWDQTKSAQIARFSRDLEGRWTTTEHSTDIPYSISSDWNRYIGN